MLEVFGQSSAAAELLLRGRIDAVSKRTGRNPSWLPERASNCTQTGASPPDMRNIPVRFLFASCKARRGCEARRVRRLRMYELGRRRGLTSLLTISGTLGIDRGSS